jgi:uncharacterized repeat protein (TIGR04138 family)
MDFQSMRSRAGQYPPQAYQFVRDGLAHTVKCLHGSMMTGGMTGGMSGGMAEHSVGPLDDTDESRHITGQQLCLGLKDYAVKQYGLLAKTVLTSWNIRETRDFGKIVFAMIDAGLMRKSEEDTLEDFDSVFTFDEVFGDVMRR